MKRFCLTSADEDICQQPVAKSQLSTFNGLPVGYYPAAHGLDEGEDRKHGEVVQLVDAARAGLKEDNK
jgi:hypothetical protein